MVFVQISIEECFTGYKIIHCFCLYKQFFLLLLFKLPYMLFALVLCASHLAPRMLAPFIFFLCLSLFFFLVYVFVCVCLSATYPIALFRQEEKYNSN